MIPSVSLDNLLGAISESWSFHTVEDKTLWNPTRPARGQCCVSSLLVISYFGGVLVRAKMSNEIIHYWVQLDNGTWIDPTRSQFDHEVVPVTIEVNPSLKLWFHKGVSEGFFNLDKSVKEKLNV